LSGTGEQPKGDEATPSATLDEPIPDDEHQTWLCPRCLTELQVMDYRSWVDGSPAFCLECPNCHWVESDRRE
jgi:hypothetical protein